MKKDELKNGMILEKTNGERGIYHDGVLVDLNGRVVANLSAYDSDLIFSHSISRGIIKIFDSDLELIYFNDMLNESIKKHGTSEEFNPFAVEGFTR